MSGISTLDNIDVWYLHLIPFRNYGLRDGRGEAMLVGAEEFQS